MYPAQSYAQKLPLNKSLYAAFLFSGCVFATLFASSSHAAGYDIMGGTGGSVQTIHHCGWIKARNEIYTKSSRNTAIIQRKLTRMGYYSGAIDGFNTPITKAAVAQFQREYGLKIDGIVGIETATAIGYIANNADWVRSCRRPYGVVASR